MSKFLKLNSSMISQIFKGERHLSGEHAALLTDFLELPGDEGEYFLLLVNYNRAGSYKLKEMLARQVELKQKESRKVVKRIKRDIILKEEQRSRFYSNWAYSAIRLACGDPSINTVEDLSERFKLPEDQINNIVQFLLSCGLCIQDEDSHLQMGPASTHLAAESPWTRVHHSNWRKKGFERYDHLEAEELIYTAPLSLNKEDAQKIREMNVKHIKEVLKIVRESEPVETFMCLGIDWFKYL